MRNPSARYLLLALAGAAMLLGTAAHAASEFSTRAQRAIVIDQETGAALYAKNADERMPPASMAKMMTAYVVFDVIRQGRLSLDDSLPVSEKAWRTGGSKMFVPLGKRVRVEDLIRGMIVQSGNDACVVLAEGVAGSEAGFVALMNQEADGMGLTGTHFANVTGWPHPEEYSTARDLATIARRLIADFPRYYRFYAEKEFVYGGIKQRNRNPLLYRIDGADGLKTGYTEEAGYGLVGSAARHGRRVVAVAAGLPTLKARADAGARLIEWAFRGTRRYRLFAAGETIAEAEVWLGAEDSVPLTVAADAVVVLPRAARRAMTVTLVYDGPLDAPVASGQTVGKLVVRAPGTETTEFPVLTAASVDEASGLSRALTAASEFLDQWSADLFPFPGDQKTAATEESG
jgi:serine-type D-Ala-D-Ala carboxypeptidase (penicillin-binding protein 5/6)